MWEHPQARQQRHLALRKTATTFLTNQADSTEEWALPLIVAYLQHSEAFRQRPYLLDAGCGPGYYLAALLTGFSLKTALAVGLDRSQDAILKAQEKLAGQPQAALVRGDILKLPFGPASFGAAMCNRMLNQTGDIAGALAAVAAVLVPGGLIFIVTADAGEASPLRAAHERWQAELGFPEKIYRHTTRSDQRFNLANGLPWLAADFQDCRLDLYERRLAFTDMAELGQYYASGLLFQKSAGLDEPAVSRDQWLELYAKVMDEMEKFIEGSGQLSYTEGAALFSAARN